MTKLLRFVRIVEGLISIFNFNFCYAANVHDQY